MTHPRIVVPGATLAVCRRTMYRKGFLGPWDPRVADVYLYALADAQRQTNVAIHDAVLVVSHHHACITPSEANVGEFFRRVHVDVSCGLNALLAQERYEAPGSVFDKRQTHAMRLLDAAAQMSQAVYHHLNPVAAGLVARAGDMPGPVADFRRWKAGGVTVKRPDVYFGRGRPEELSLELTPPPLLLEAFGGDLDALVYHLGRVTNDATAQMKRARKRPAMGAQKLRRLHPWSEPRTLAEPGGGRVPTFKLGAGGLTGRRDRGRAAGEVSAFRKRYRGNYQRYREGARDEVFPHGTYRMHIEHGVAVDPPDFDAIVCAPGPSLAAVRERCEERRQGAGRQAGATPRSAGLRRRDRASARRVDRGGRRGGRGRCYRVRAPVVGCRGPPQPAGRHRSPAT